MYKCLYDSFGHWYKDKTIYLYADPHFGDSDMKYLRENNISDDEQVERINSRVGPNDTLIILGDVGDIKYVRKLRGYKVLIKGNHDAGTFRYQKRTEYVGRYRTKKDVANGIWKDEIDSYSHPPLMPFYNGFKSNKLFDEVYEGILTISPKIILSHEPVEWKYGLNLHGHDHSKTEFVDDMHINLCAEHIDYTPVCLTDIIKSGRLKNVVDIHRETIDNAIIRSKKNDSQTK